MGRLLFFIIIIGAALAGVWFYVPGGQDMLLGAKDKAMSYMPGAADASDDADVVSEEIVVDDMVDEAMDDASDMADDMAGDMDDDMAADDMGGDDMAAEEEPQE